MEALKGHVSVETAYVVDDYPYGFTLRTKIRYWLEFKKGKGFRFVSQTLNPKVAGEKWNKPKASTYSRLGGVMLRNPENGHITWNGLSEYDDATQCQAFLDKYAPYLPEEGLFELERFVRLKRSYERNREAGEDMSSAAIHAEIEEVNRGS